MTTFNFSVFAFLILAAPLSPASEIAPPSLPDELMIEALKIQEVDRSELAAIVSQVNNKQVSKAKKSLADYLTRFPNDTTALEIAGGLLLMDKRYSAAKAAFTNIIKLSPGHINARLKLGISLIESGNQQAGVVELKNVLHLDPNNIPALGYLAWLSKQSGEYLQAKTYFKQIIKLEQTEDSQFLPFHLEIAEILLIEQNHQAVLTLLKPLHLEIKPDNSLSASASLMLSNALLHQGKTDSARQVVDKLSKVFPGDLSVTLVSANLLMAEDRTQAAILTLETYLNQHPDSLRIIYELAKKYAAQGKQEKAVVMLEHLIKTTKSPGPEDLVRDIISIYGAAGELEKAEQVAQKYTKDFPGNPVLLYLKAEVEVLKGDTGKAISTLEKLSQVHPNYLPAYFLASKLSEDSLINREKYLKQAVFYNSSSTRPWIELTNFYYSLDALTKAEQTLENAVLQNPNNTQLLFEYAGLLDVLNKKQQANKFYRRTLVNDPTHNQALHNLIANLATSNTGWEEATLLGKTAYSRGTTDPFILDSYGLVLLRTGKTEQAQSILTQALSQVTDELRALDPVGVAHIHYHKGQAFIESKNLKLARREFKFAISLGLNEEKKATIAQYLN